MRLTHRLAMASVLAGVALPLAAQDHVITPHDIVTLKRVAEVQLSPDGSQVAYSVTTPQPATEAKVESIWITSATTPGTARMGMHSDGADSHPMWSPDGKQIAFLSTRKNPIRLKGASPFPFALARVQSRPDLTEAQTMEPKKDAKQGAQLWVLPVGGGEAVPLTNIPGNITALKWSPDGKQIAFVRADVDTRAEADRKEKKIDDKRVDFDYRFDRLYIYDIASHTATLVTEGERNLCDFDWSPDGKHFVARIAPTPRLDDYWRVSKIQVLNAATGEVEKTLAEHAASQAVSWSPDGRYATFSKMTERTITGVSVVYNLDSGKEVIADSAEPATWQKMQWSGDSKHLFSVGVKGTTAVIGEVNPATGKITIESEHASALNDFDLSRDGKMAVFATGTTSHPAEVMTLHDRAWKTLTETNPQVKDWKLGTVKEVQWKSTRDGHPIYGVLILPAGYVQGQRYKTLVQFHGGPEGVWENSWLGSWHDWAQMMASHGWAVLLPNPRGSDGQGTAFTESNFQDWGGADFQDEMDGVDYAVASGVSDKDKLVAGGWSYGGFMTSWTVTHTDRFKAAIVGAGVTDLTSMATITDIAPSFLDGYFGPLATHREMYREHSPVTFLSNVKTPVLVVHGEADDRVPISQGQEFYYGLRFMGRETQMIRFPREPHVFAERDHQEALLQHVYDWYSSHVK